MALTLGMQNSKISSVLQDSKDPKTLKISKVMKVPDDLYYVKKRLPEEVRSILGEPKYCRVDVGYNPAGELNGYKEPEGGAARYSVPSGRLHYDCVAQLNAACLVRKEGDKMGLEDEFYYRRDGKQQKSSITSGDVCVRYDEKTKTLLLYGGFKSRDGVIRPLTTPNGSKLEEKHFLVLAYNKLSSFGIKNTKKYCDSRLTAAICSSDIVNKIEEEGKKDHNESDATGVIEYYTFVNDSRYWVGLIMKSGQSDEYTVVDR